MSAPGQNLSRKRTLFDRASSLLPAQPIYLQLNPRMEQMAHHLRIIRVWRHANGYTAARRRQEKGVYGGSSCTG